MYELLRICIFIIYVLTTIPLFLRDVLQVNIHSKNVNNGIVLNIFLGLAFLVVNSIFDSNKLYLGLVLVNLFTIIILILYKFALRNQLKVFNLRDKSIETDIEVYLKKLRTTGKLFLIIAIVMMLLITTNMLKVNKDHVYLLVTLEIVLIINSVIWLKSSKSFI